MAPRLPFMGPVPLGDRAFRRSRINLNAWLKRIVGGLVALFFLLSIATFVAYRFPAGDPFLRFMSRVFPVQAMRVNDDRVRYHVYLSARRGWEGLLTLQGETLDQDLDERVQELIARALLLQQLLVELNLRLNEAQVEVVVTHYCADFARAGVSEAVLLERTRWDREDIRSIVVAPLVRRQQLAELVYGIDRLQESTRASAEERYNELIREAFRASESGRGVAGVLLEKEPDVRRELDEYEFEVQQALRGLEGDMISTVVERDTLFEIYAVLAREGDTFLTRRLAIPKATVADVLSEREASARIRVFVR